MTINPKDVEPAKTHPCDSGSPTTESVPPPDPEICDGLDNDGDGDIDEGLPVDVWYQDCDQDGVGRSPLELATSGVVACDVSQLPPTDDPSRCLWDTEAGDCDDTTPNIRPYIADQCDCRDNDCDSYVDEDWDENCCD